MGQHLVKSWQELPGMSLSPRHQGRERPCALPAAVVEGLCLTETKYTSQGCCEQSKKQWELNSYGLGASHSSVSAQ